MVTVKRARKIILKNSSMIKAAERLPLISCLGRTLAADVKSPLKIPSFSNSAMDGYAVKHSDTKGASQDNPKLLEVIEDIPAGYLPKKSIRSGQAARIMTGAPLPDGADTVVMVEFTEKAKEYVRILREAKRWDCVRKAGEDVKKGETVLTKGALIRSQELMLLSAVSMAHIKVTRKPRVAVLATGDELVDIKIPRLPMGKIRNSNTYGLYGAVSNAGAHPIIIGIARDNKPDLRRKIKSALASNIDMLLVVGGISVGDYDIVKDTLKELGTRMLFWRVAMRPGKPLAFGVISGVPVFGLPGNPVSAMIAFEQFVRPAILKMLGARELDRPMRQAYFAGDDVEKKKGLRYFLRVALENKDGEFYARLSGKQGSAMLKSMVKADGIMVLPEAATEVSAGDKVWVQLLN